MPKTTNAEDARTPDVEFVLPAHNDARRIGLSVTLLAQWLRRNAQFSWKVTVADGASTDQTLAIASRMRDQDPTHVGVIHLDKGGHGLAVKSAWLASDARVVAYMDAGLSTDLRAIPDLVTPLLAGCADVTCGSRLSRSAHATCRRGSELASRCHNLLLNLAFSYHASDAKCPLKAMRAQVARTFLPIVQDDGRFFDTELLVVSHQAGLTVREVPVTWVEHPDATAGAPGAARRELACVMRLRADIRAHVLDTRIASVCPARTAGCDKPGATLWQAQVKVQAQRMASPRTGGRERA